MHTEKKKTASLNGQVVPASTYTKSHNRLLLTPNTSQRGLQRTIYPYTLNRIKDYIPLIYPIYP